MCKKTDNWKIIIQKYCKHKKSTHIGGYFMLLMLLLMMFTGVFPIYTPVNADTDDILYVREYNLCTPELDIHIFAYYNDTPGLIFCTMNLSQPDVGFGKTLLYCFNIDTTQNNFFLNATIEFTVKKEDINKSRVSAYYYDKGKWGKELQNNDDGFITVNTTHFSTWSIVYIDWNYRINITITNSGGALVDYQIPIILNDTNFNYSHADSLGDDVRFTDADDNTLFYWIEFYKNSSDESIIWVNVTSIAASDDTTIFLYYGNETATAESDGTNTFIFFDNFTDDDVTDWTVIGGTWSASDGMLKQTGAGGSIYPNLCPSNIVDSVTDFDMRCTGSSRSIGCFHHLDTTNGDGYGWYIGHDGSNYARLLVGWGLGSYWEFTGSTFSQNVWYDIQHRVLNNNLEVFKNNVSLGDHTDSTYTIGSMCFRSAYAGAEYDNLRIRKYASPKPTVTVGDEEEKPPPPPPHMVYPNHVSFPNLQYEYIKITVNDSNYIQSDINVTFPSVYYYNYSINDDNEVYIYGNETGLYTYQFLTNESLGYWYNGSFTVIKNIDYEDNALYNQLVNIWIWGIIILILYWVLILLSKKHLLYGLGSITIATYMLAFQQSWLPYWISLILLILAWYCSLKWILDKTKEED